MRSTSEASFSGKLPQKLEVLLFGQCGHVVRILGTRSPFPFPLWKDKPTLLKTSKSGYWHMVTLFEVGRMYCNYTYTIDQKGSCATHITEGPCGYVGWWPRPGLRPTHTSNVFHSGGVKRVGGVALLETGLRLSFCSSAGSFGDVWCIGPFFVSCSLGAGMSSVLASTPICVLQERTWLQAWAAPPICCLVTIHIPYLWDPSRGWKSVKWTPLFQWSPLAGPMPVGSPAAMWTREVGCWAQALFRVPLLLSRCPFDFLFL